jgi:hypothetical protein
MDYKLPPTNNEWQRLPLFVKITIVIRVTVATWEDRLWRRSTRKEFDGVLNHLDSESLDALLQEAKDIEQSKPKPSPLVAWLYLVGLRLGRGL